MSLYYLFSVNGSGMTLIHMACIGSHTVTVTACLQLLLLPCLRECIANALLTLYCIFSEF